MLPLARLTVVILSLSVALVAADAPPKSSDGWRRIMHADPAVFEGRVLRSLDGADSQPTLQ